MRLTPGKLIDAIAAKLTAQTADSDIYVEVPVIECAEDGSNRRIVRYLYPLHSAIGVSQYNGKSIVIMQVVQDARRPVLTEQQQATVG